MLLNLQTVFYICTNLRKCKFVSKAWNEKNSSSSRKAVWLCYLKDGVAYITLFPILRSFRPSNPSSTTKLPICVQFHRFQVPFSFWWILLGPRAMQQSSPPDNGTILVKGSRGMWILLPNFQRSPSFPLMFPPKTPGIRHLWPSCCRNRVKKTHLTFISCTSNCHDFTLVSLSNCHLELYSIQEASQGVKGVTFGFIEHDSRKKLLGDDSDDSTISGCFLRAHAKASCSAWWQNDYNSTKEHIHSDPLFS